ncbi:autotransporter-associated beta strand repeat-containing protein [Dyella sp. 2RAB6]|uniref:autotransporter-associated beta strand repeat-containing protein n=1 Tax=Dyella sp. 2RAB6 TaxID=3232992 RepID=UPI003F8E5F3E
MNRIYRLVWNRSLRLPQVASELAHSRRSVSGAGMARIAPAWRPLALAIGLAMLSSTAWGACTSSASNIPACSAPGGAGIPQRTGGGGAGNGSGGGASVFNSGTGTTDPVVGSPAAANGTGGAGAAGTSAGGSGGSVGTSGGGVLDITATSTGGAGANGQDALSFASGGGGGGAGVVFSGIQLNIDPGAIAVGGAGGAGGNGNVAFSSSNGAGGGGGGAGVLARADDGDLQINGQVTGGAGGVGGGGGNNGGGGAGGDGVLVLGQNISTTNSGVITGGAGAAAGTATFDNSAQGGSGGAGVNLVGQFATLENDGSITGGAGAMGGQGGTGVVTWGDNTIVNGPGGSISGGLNPDGSTALAIQFNGTGNALTMFDGGSIVGGIDLAAGAQARVFAQDVNMVLDNAITLGAGSTITGDMNGADGLQFSGPISGSGALAVTGAGTLTLSGTGTYTGGTSIDVGSILQIGNGGTTGSIVGDVHNQGTLAFNRSDTVALGGVIDGSGNLEQDGAGTLVLSGVNTYTGATTINSGTLALSGNGSIASSSGVAVNGTFDISGTSSGAAVQAISGAGHIVLGNETLTLTNASGSFDGLLSGSGGLSISGGSQTLTIAQAYTGATGIGVGATLALTGAGSIASSQVVSADGTFDISGTTSGSSIQSLAGAGSVVLGTQNLTLIQANALFAGIISGSGNVTLAGGSETLSGINTYTGQTSIDGGATLALSGAGSIAASSGVVDDGSFDISGTTSGADIRTLTGSGSVLLGAQYLNLTNASGTFAGNISGNGGLSIAGGTQTLSGANTYTGQTTVANGATLALTGTGSIADSAGVLLNGGTFDIAGTSLGASITRLAGNGNVTLGAETLTLTNGGGTYAGVIGGSGGLTVSGGAQTLSGVQAYTGATSIGSGATLALSGPGSIAASSGVASDGTFDISGTSSGASIRALTGSGTVNLGAQNLTLTQASGSFSGAIGSTGGVEISAGTQTLSGNNSYTGATTIDSGATLALSGSGGIASSSGVANDGTFDIAGTTAGASIQQLSGSGAVTLGAQTLTIANAGGSFGGIISGTGGLTVAGGAQFLGGVNTYSGLTTIDGGGVLALSGNGSIAASSGVLANGLFDIAGTTSGASIASLGGSGAGSQVNLGLRTLTLTQASGNFGGSIGGAGDLVLAGGTQSLGGNNTYTGATTIQSGATLALTGTGSIAASSGVANGGTFDISGTSAGASIKALTGNGGVNLGAQTLTLTNASGSYDGVMAGAGGVAIAGGTQVFSATQSYTGQTMVGTGAMLTLTGAGSIASSGAVTVDGTLDVTATSSGATIQGLSGGGAVSLGSQPLTLAGSGQFAGGISGAGGLNVTGAQTLSGSNTYTGATAINGGSLSLQGAGSIATSSGLTLTSGTFDISAAGSGATVANLTGSGSVNLGGNVLNIAQATGTFDGIIGGTGGLTLSGGTQTLTGVNTYTGATTINGATLALQGNGSIAASSGVTLANGNLDISATTSGASIAGLAGTGSVNLGGQPLTITQGNGTFGGVIGGAGALTVSGGTQTLSGANTYTGATTVTGGTLALTGGGSLVPATVLALNGSGAAFDISAAGAQTIASLAGVTGSRVALGGNTLNLGSGTFAGSFTGSGILNKQGSAVLTVNGDSSAFTGTTNVTAGTLAVGDASSPTAVLGGNVVVSAQGKLQGHGSIGGSVTNNGMVAPGGSIGTLAVAGNYVQAVGGTLSIEVSPTDASLLKVGGNANLGGTLALTYDPGTYTAHQYTILTAGGSVTGTFGNVTSTFANGAALGTLTPAVTYGANQVGLSLATPSAPGAPSGPVVIAPTQTSNYAALGTAALLRAQSANAALVDSAVLDDKSRKGDGLWVTAAGAGTDIESRSGQPGFHMNQYGLMMGVDRPWGDATVGIAAGFSHSNLRENVTGDTAQTDTVRLALYGAQPLGALRLSGSVGYAFDDLSQKRNFAGIGVAEGDHVGHEFTAALQAAMPIAVGGGTLTPSVGARYAYFHGNAFGEDGARGQNLRVGADSARSLQPYVGLKFDQSFDHDGKPLDLQLRAGYATETAGRHRGVTVAAQDGSLFAAPGTDLPRSYATLGASVVMHPTKASTLSLSYDALINVGHASAQAASVTFSYRF